MAAVRFDMLCGELHGFNMKLWRTVKQTRGFSLIRCWIRGQIVETDFVATSVGHTA